MTLKGGSEMIRSFTAILISLFLLANIVQADEPYVPKEKEELYSIWANEEYDGKFVNSKWDYNSDGTWASYQDTSGEPIWAGQYSITEKRTDAEENIWYKIKWINKYNGASGYGLLKISDSGQTLEAAYSMGDYPAKIDSNKSFWEYGGIHYSKKGGFKASGHKKQEFNDAQRAIWKEVQALWDYLKQGDLESVMSCIHNDALLWWREFPKPYNKDTVELSYRDWIYSAKPESYELKPLSIQIIGNVANIYYVCKWSGQGGLRRIRVMNSYVKKSDKWLLFGSASASCVKPPNCDEAMK
jgi:ketosteroid isomerase-like protein